MMALIAPFSSSQCWVLLHGSSGSLWSQSVQCSVKTRDGFLTCRHHIKYETQAQNKTAWLLDPKAQERHQQALAKYEKKLEALRKDASVSDLMKMRRAVK